MYTRARDVATKLIKVFYKQLFIDRFFHADPHPGNFFVQKGPQGQVRIVVLDLGSATELRANLADGMFDILQGLMTRKDDLVVKGIDEMGFMAPDTGVRTVHRRRLDRIEVEEGTAARDAAAAELEAEWAVESQPWEAAANIILDDVIDPRETRDVIATGIEFAWGSRQRVTSKGC